MTTNKFSIMHKLIAVALTFIFIIHSLQNINSHTYNINGVEIHRHDCTTPVHLSTFCENYNLNF